MKSIACDVFLQNISGKISFCLGWRLDFMISSVIIENDSVANNKKKNGKNIMNPELTENRGQAEEWRYYESCI